MTVVVMMGIPGSGKSTYVREHYPSTLVVCPDDIREELTGDAADQSRNNEVFALAHERLEAAVSVNLDVVFDATNIKEFARRNILDVCRKHGADTHLIVMMTDFETCSKRNSERDRVVPLHAMQRMDKEFCEVLANMGRMEWGNITYVH